MIFVCSCALWPTLNMRQNDALRAAMTMKPHPMRRIMSIEFFCSLGNNKTMLHLVVIAIAVIGVTALTDRKKKMTGDCKVS